MPSGTCLIFTPYCPGSIGEQIVQLPFFQFLAERYGRENLVAVSPEGSSFLIEAAGAVAAVDVFPNSRVPGVLVRTSRHLRELRADVAYQIRAKSTRTSILARLSGVHRVHGFGGTAAAWIHDTSVPYSEEEYFAETYTRLLGRSLAEFQAARPREDGDYVLCIPCGRVPIKRYPLEHYLRVADALNGRRVVKFLLGPDAGDDATRVRRAGHEVVCSPPIPAMLDVVRRASIVIANDCGPAHAAHIHDVPRVSLFALPRKTLRWFYPGRNGRVMTPPGGKGIEAIDPEEVVAVAKEVLSSAC